MPATMTEVTTADGRQVEVMHSELDGRAIVVSHGGTPGGAAEWPRMTELAEARGLGFVTCNRPGYGASTPRPDRTVAMIAEDTAAVLDHLGVGEFVSLGISGGGPHAFADGALLGERCRGVVDVAGLAPVDLDGLDFYDGMSDDNRASFEAAKGGPEALKPFGDLYQALMSEITAEVLMETAPAMLPPVDVAILEGPDARSFLEYFAAMMRAAFSSGTAGMVDDMIALSRPWGFDLRTVQVPVIVWHGEADENVPVGHGRAIAAAVPSCNAHFLPKQGHLSIFSELPAIVDDLASLAG